MKLELSLYGSGLKNVAGAFRGTSDPFAVVTRLSQRPGDRPEVLGRTEVVKNSLSPQWTTTIGFDYELGTPVKLAVSIFDEVKKGENKSMGSSVFDVGELLGARGNTKAKKLHNGGTLFAMVRKSSGSGVLRLKMKGVKLKNVEGFLSKSDPFFELSRKVDAAGSLTFDNVYRSKPVHNNLSPTWDDAVVQLSTLCGGDLDLPVLVTVFDHESSGKHIPMGQFETSVNGLVAASTDGNEDMGKAIAVTKKGKECGKVIILKAQVSGVDSVTAEMSKATIAPSPTPSAAAVADEAPGGGGANFIDYISGGCELNVVVAVDFTGSNGDPRVPGALHHIDPNSMNDYEKAITAIVGILSKYDTDQKFPVVGFGAKYDGVVRHCFQCGSQEEVHGVQGVLDAYHQVFRSGLIMSGPTVFTEVMEMAAARAKSSLEAAKQQGKQTYTILLVITDGAVSDVQATAACLKQISGTPISVVIVGVGNADFSGMQFLDDAMENVGRDVAQFVPFNKHSSNSADLTSATLNEVPTQLVRYFQGEGIQPLPPVHAKESEIVVEDEEEIDLSLDITEDEIVVSSGGGYRGAF